METATENFPAPAPTPERKAAEYAADLVVSVSRISRDDLTCDPPAGHRGVWAFDPALYPDAVAGRYVRFENNGECFARGLVVQVVERGHALAAGVCSGVNSRAMLWKAVADAVAPGPPDAPAAYSGPWFRELAEAAGRCRASFKGDGGPRREVARDAGTL